ncbi:unnamed protein product [Phytophthora fragariaefolia]|uniref:Unnamed protein product n=1 Tax=Phytophthora fragariaefolia TaxID=1490495 RepID=A0A9W6XIY9_9STRA|nr:unnamed protein product [Phytophthora fragariaefolia]
MIDNAKFDCKNTPARISWELDNGTRVDTSANQPTPYTEHVEAPGICLAEDLGDKVPEERWDRLLWHAEEVIKLRGLDEHYLDTIGTWVESYYDENVGCFDFSLLYKPYPEALEDWEFYPERDEDISHYVSVVRNECPSRTLLPRIGLVEVVTVNLPNGFGVLNEGEDGCGVYRVIEDGRRVVCAVGNFEALPSGYIDCLPSRMLADTGATLSLVDRWVLKRLERMFEPLEPYEGLTKSSSGHKLRIRGWSSLSFRLGTMEVSMSVLVADQLHVDSILGVDALGAFGELIDVPEWTMTLTSSDEVLPLGFTVIEGSYAVAMSSSVRLPPRGQALGMAVVDGDVSGGATVLVKGSIGLPPTLCVARSLCTIEDVKSLLNCATCPRMNVGYGKGRW